MTMSSMSRRGFLPLVAGAALSPVVLVPQAARAQGANWQIYRREDLGFEIEMPGKPKIEVEEFERDDLAVKSITAVVDVEQISFGAGYNEYRKPISLEEEVLAQRLLARGLGARTVRETTIHDERRPRASTSAWKSSMLLMAMRIVVIRAPQDLGGVMRRPAASPTNANVRRFLDSLQAAAITEIL